MALVHSSITVGTAATSLVTLPAGIGDRLVSICNNDSSSIFVGGRSVTNASGAHPGQVIVSNGNASFSISGNDVLFAISTGGTANFAVSVIYSGV
jgi:hypothetical protein